MERTVTMPLGVIVERREIDHPWQKCIWRPVAVMPGTAPVDDWTELARGRGFVRFFCGTLPLSLHRGETEAYRYTLANTPPPVYVVLRSADAREDGREIRPFLVTASPYEAEDFLDSGDEIVEAVRANGVPVEYVLFDDEGHGFVKKENQEKAYGAILAFLDKYLKGVDKADIIAAAPLR